MTCIILSAMNDKRSVSFLYRYSGRFARFKYGFADEENYSFFMKLLCKLVCGYQLADHIQIFSQVYLRLGHLEQVYIFNAHLRRATSNPGESVYDASLHADISVDDARELLKENRDKELISYRVSRAVHSCKVSGLELVKP